MLCSTRRKLLWVGGTVLFFAFAVISPGHVQAQEAIRFCDVPTTLPRGTPLPNYSPALCFEYSGLKQESYVIKAYLLEATSGNFFCASNQLCGDAFNPKAVFPIDNRDGTKSAGKLVVVRQMDVFDYLSFLWVADLHNQAGNKAASATQSANSTTNKAPVLNAIGNKGAAVGQLLEFVVSASDPDGDAVNLSAQNLPTGATFDAASGKFRWPSPVAGTYPDILFKATQAGPIPLSDAELITIIVSPPLASVSAASFSGASLASESIAVAFGSNLATGTQVATTLPLPTSLAGAQVLVKDSAGTERLAPLFFAAPGQINYQIPPGIVTGAATITVSNGNTAVGFGTTQIEVVAPGLFAANASGQGVAAAYALRVKAGGSQTTDPVAQFDTAQSKFVSVPIDLGPESDQVFLVLFGTGIRFRSALSAVTAKIGGVDAQVMFAGPQGGFVGLDQVNLLIPRSLAGRGEVDVTLIVNGKLANTVKVNIK